MARNDKTIKSRTEKTYIDTQTGEVLSEETTTTFKVPQEPEFVKVYTEAMTARGLRDHHMTMIFFLVRKMTYDNMICLTPGARVRIGEAMGIQQATFRNYLNALLEKDVFRRTGHGEFMVNPTLIARGKFDEIQPRIERYYEIERVKTQKGREPGKVKGQGNLELVAD